MYDIITYYHHIFYEYNINIILAIIATLYLIIGLAILIDIIFFSPTLIIEIEYQEKINRSNKDINKDVRKK